MTNAEVPPEMRDVRFPEEKRSRFAQFGDKEQDPAPAKRSIPRSMILIVSIAGIFLLVFGGYVALSAIMQSAKKPGSLLPTADPAWQSFVNLLQGGSEAYGGLVGLSSSVMDLLESASQIEESLPMFLAGEPTDLAGLLQGARDKLDAVSRSLESLVSGDANAAKNIPIFGDYISLNSHVARGKDLLDGLVAMLKDPAERHILVILANTSELRPGGGFTGSFADVAIENGRVKNITVLDINEVDREREELTIPPKPLQAIVGRWRAADANWFFDYPASAKKTLEFIEESDLYASTTIDGLVSVTPAAMQDLLSAVGPIKLSGGREINAKNFMAEIQEEVQEGQAEGDPAPKAILREVAPILISRLTKLSDDRRSRLLEDAKDWLRNKEVMIYMKDERLTRVLKAYNADGSLFEMPDGFIGDYLAVVDANIGGGKTDGYIERDILVESNITESGAVHDKVTVTRTHGGDRAAEWWYQATNWNYLQIFTPTGVTVDAFEGGGRRSITPKADYRKGFEADQDILTLEGTRIASGDNLEVFRVPGRSVFATWQKVAAGDSKKLILAYSRMLPHPPRDGMEYQFVFERQSGAKMDLTVRITAPVGFVWQEGDVPIYEHRDTSPPGRTLLSLTLKKI